MSAAPFAHTLPAVDGASPPYYTQLLRDAEKKQRTAYNTRVDKTGGSNFFSSYYSAAGGGGIIEEADAVYHLFTFTCKELYARHSGQGSDQRHRRRSSAVSGGTPSASCFQDSSAIFTPSATHLSVDTDHVSTSESTVQHLSAATSGDTSIAKSKNASPSEDLLLDCYRLNHQLMHVAESPLTSFRRHDVWEARQNALRNFLGSGRLTIAQQLLQTVRDDLLNQVVSGFVQLEEDQRSFLHPVDGLFAHVWNDAKEARRYMSCAQRVWQTIFEHRMVPFGTPSSTIVQTRGHAVTFTAVVPVCGSPLPTLGGTGVSEGTKLLSKLLGVANIDDEEESSDDDDSDDSGEFKLKDSNSQSISFSTPPVNPKLFYGVDNRYYFMQPTLFGIQLEKAVQATSATTTMALGSNNSNTPLRLEAYHIAFPEGLAAEYRAADVLQRIRTKCVSDAATAILAAAEASPKLTELVQNNAASSCLHGAGCNMRMLYFVYKEIENRIPSEGSRSPKEITAIELVEAEILTRALKHLVRAELFSKAGENDAGLLQRVNRFLGYVSGNSAAIWTQIMIVVREKFMCPSTFNLKFSAKMVKIMRWFLTPRMGIAFDQTKNSFSKFATGSVPGSSFLFVPEPMKLTSQKKTDLVTGMLKIQWEYAVSIPVSGESSSEALTKMLRVLFLETIVNYQNVIETHTKVIEGKAKSVAQLLNPLAALHIASFLCEFYSESMPLMIQQGSGTPLQMVTDLLEKTCENAMKGPGRSPSTIHFCNIRTRILAQVILGSARATEESRSFGLTLLSKSLSSWLSLHEDLLLQLYGSELTSTAEDPKTITNAQAMQQQRGRKRMSVFKGGADISSGSAKSIYDLRTNPRLVDDAETILNVRGTASSPEQYVIMALLSRAAHIDSGNKAHMLAIRQMYRSMMKEQTERFYDTDTISASNRRDMHIFAALCHLVHTQDVQFVADTPNITSTGIHSDPEVVSSFTRCVTAFLHCKYVLEEKSKAACLDAFIESSKFVNTMYPVTASTVDEPFFGEDEASDVKTAVGSSSFASSVAMTLTNHLIPADHWGMALIVYHNMKHGIEGGVYSGKNTKMKDALLMVEEKQAAAEKIQNAFRLASSTGGNAVGSAGHEQVIAKRMVRLEATATAYFSGWSYMIDAMFRKMSRLAVLDEEETMRSVVIIGEEPSARDAIELQFTQEMEAFAVDGLIASEEKNRHANIHDEALRRLEEVDATMAIELTNIEEATSWTQLMSEWAAASQAASLDLCEQQEQRARHAMEREELSLVTEMTMATTIDGEEEVEVEGCIPAEESIERATLLSSFSLGLGAVSIDKAEGSERNAIEFEEISGAAEIIAESIEAEALSGLEHIVSGVSQGMGFISLEREEQEGRDETDAEAMNELSPLYLQAIEEEAVIIMTTTINEADELISKLIKDCNGNATFLQLEAEETRIREGLFTEHLLQSIADATESYLAGFIVSATLWPDMVQQMGRLYDVELASRVKVSFEAECLAVLDELAKDCQAKASGMATEELLAKEEHQRHAIEVSCWDLYQQELTDPYESLARCAVEQEQLDVLLREVQSCSASWCAALAKEEHRLIMSAFEQLVENPLTVSHITDMEAAEKRTICCDVVFDAVGKLYVEATTTTITETFPAFAEECIAIDVMSTEDDAFNAIFKASRESKEKKDRWAIEESEQAARTKIQSPVIGQLGGLLVDATSSLRQALMADYYSTLITVVAEREEHKRRLIPSQQARSYLDLMGPTRETLLREILEKEEKRAFTFIKKQRKILSDENAKRESISAERERQIDDFAQVFRILVKNMRSDLTELHPHLIPPSKREVKTMLHNREIHKMEKQDKEQRKAAKKAKDATEGQGILTSAVFLEQAALLEEIAERQTRELDTVESHCFDRIMQHFRSGRDVIVKKMRKAANRESIPMITAMHEDLHLTSQSHPALVGISHLMKPGTPPPPPAKTVDDDAGMMWMEALGAGDFVPMEEHYDVRADVVVAKQLSPLKIKKMMTALQAKEVLRRQEIAEHFDHFMSTCRIERRDIESLMKSNAKVDHRRGTTLLLIPLLASFNLPPAGRFVAKKKLPEKSSVAAAGSPGTKKPKKARCLPGIGYERSPSPKKEAAVAEGTPKCAATPQQTTAAADPQERHRKAATSFVTKSRALVVSCEAALEKIYSDEATDYINLMARGQIMLKAGASMTHLVDQKKTPSKVPSRLASLVPDGKRQATPSLAWGTPQPNRSASPLRTGETDPLGEALSNELLDELHKSELRVLGMVGTPHEVDALEGRLRDKLIEIHQRVVLGLMRDFTAGPNHVDIPYVDDAGTEGGVRDFMEDLSPPSYCSPRTMLLRDLARKKRDVPNGKKPINEQKEAVLFQLTHGTKSTGLIRAGAGGYTMPKAANASHTTASSPPRRLAKINNRAHTSMDVASSYSHSPTRTRRDLFAFGLTSPTHSIKSPVGAVPRDPKTPPQEKRVYRLPSLTDDNGSSVQSAPVERNILDDISRPTSAATATTADEDDDDTAELRQTQSI